MLGTKKTDKTVVMNLSAFQKNKGPDSIPIYAHSWIHFPVDHPMEEVLTRSGIRRHFRDILGINATQAQDLLNILIREATSIIASSRQLKLSGFGTFLVHDKKARLGRNPKTKEEAIIAPRKSVSFRPSPILKKAINVAQNAVKH